MEPALLQQRVVRWGPNIQTFVLFIMLNHCRRNGFKFSFSSLFFVVAWRTQRGTSCSVWACHRQIQAEITFTGWSKYLRQQWMSTPSWWGCESKSMEWMLWKIVELPVKADCYWSLFIIFDNMKWGSSCFMETIFVFLDVLHRLIFPRQKSSMKRVPILSLKGALHLNPKVDPYQNEVVVQMWMEVKLKPLLHSITKNFLSCLSTKNFSCSTYQTMYIRAREAPVDSRCARLSPQCPLLQGKGAEPPFLWDESSQTEVDLHLLHVPFSVRRQNRW